MVGATGERTLTPAVEEAVRAGLERVRARFEAHLASELPPVTALCRHIERYRGKMLRPTLVLAWGLATHRPPLDAHHLARAWTDRHIALGAVCEMIHMATLVHDDVLDEADTRRRGQTVNHLRGNETAVMLGDYLLGAAYHLCSTLDWVEASLLIGQTSVAMCAGELLQLHHRDDYSLDEPTYFEIVERKTAALIGAAARLGAMCSGADAGTCDAAQRFGTHLGVAFQVQDDLLDLTGREATVGKSVGKDLEKGKLTLPLIHHLDAVAPSRRGRSLLLVERATGREASASPAERADAVRALVAALEESGSAEWARAQAARRIAHAKHELAVLPGGPARDLLEYIADAALDRSF